MPDTLRDILYNRQNTARRAELEDVLRDARNISAAPMPTSWRCALPNGIPPNGSGT